MKYEDIKARHEASQQSTDIPANEEFWQCLEDRGWLIDRIKELESDISAALTVLPLLPMSAERILRSRVVSDD